MTIRTGQKIENDVYELLNDVYFPWNYTMANLNEIISGKVYKFGMRPRDSQAEDVVVKFVTGLPDQIHTGVVVVCVYVPDIAPWDNGVFVRNISRCQEVEEAASEWVSKLTTAVSDYKFRLAQTIYTEEEPDIKQHFISIRLNYNLLTI